MTKISADPPLKKGIDLEIYELSKQFGHHIVLQNLNLSIKP